MGAEKNDHGVSDFCQMTDCRGRGGGGKIVKKYDVKCIYIQSMSVLLGRKTKMLFSFLMR